LGEKLHIEAPICSELLERLPRIEEMYGCFDRKMSSVEVAAPSESRPPSHGRSVGLFFSGGVDSSYSLVKNWERHRHDPEAVTHLISVLGFDLYQWEADAYPAGLQSIRGTAARFHKDVIPVSTNLRDLADRVVDWPRLHHGAALASVGLALSGCLRSTLIAASCTYVSLFPWGSHPLLDPLWANESVSFEHDGLERNRLEKLRVLGKYPDIMRVIRVCIADNSPGNCGRCQKCVRTSLCMHATGVLHLCPTMPQTVRADLVRTIKVRTPGMASLMNSVLEALSDSPEDMELKEAVADILREYEETRRGAGGRGALPGRG